MCRTYLIHWKHSGEVRINGLKHYFKIKVQLLLVMVSANTPILIYHGVFNRYESQKRSKLRGPQHNLVLTRHKNIQLIPSIYPLEIVRQWCQVSALRCKLH